MLSGVYVAAWSYACHPSIEGGAPGCGESPILMLAPRCTDEPPSSFPSLLFLTSLQTAFPFAPDVPFLPNSEPTLRRQNVHHDTGGV